MALTHLSEAWRRNNGFAFALPLLEMLELPPPVVGTN